MSRTSTLRNLQMAADTDKSSVDVIQWVLAFIVGLLGVLSLHHGMIGSGFRRIQGNLGDARLLNYLLEHGWLWVTRTPGHHRFWEAPFFHPTPNVIAYSDSMFSYGPLYWPFRLAGLDPEPAFGLWMVAASSLNYTAGLLLFRDGLRSRIPAAVAGAGLIAFGSPRVNQLGHAQLVPCFYVLLALYALCRIFREPRPGAVERAVCWLGLGLATSAQLYGGVYLGWFFVLGLGVATSASLLLRISRGRVLEVLTRDWWAAAGAAVVWAIAMGPFFSHYLRAAREFGGGFNAIQVYTHAAGWSWLSVGESNWWWGWIERQRPIRGNPFPGEQHLGIGFLTPAACAVGLYLGRRNAVIRVSFATLLVGLAAMTLVPTERIVNASAATVCLALGCLFHEPDWTKRGASVFVLATVVMLWSSPYNDVMRALTLVMIAFCFARVVSRRGRIEEQLAPGAALALLVLHLFPPSTTALMAAMVVPAAIAPAYLRPARRWESALLAVGLALAGTAWLVFESRPLVLVGAVAGATFGWEGARMSRFRPDPRTLCKALIVAFVLVLLLYSHNSIWLAVSPYIPGAGAIRVPSRIALILLIPAGVGLAAVVERLDRGRRRWIAWGLVLLCLAEQGGSASTYDLAEARARVDALARRIDPRAESFYYRPATDESFIDYGLDAMWASFRVGVPTINGYSGGMPRGWFMLAKADAPLPEAPSTEEALAEWCDKTRLPSELVQRLGKPACESTGAWSRSRDSLPSPETP